MDKNQDFLNYSKQLPSSYSLLKIKYLAEFMINNSYFQAGSETFRQVISIALRSDPATFFDNLLLFFYESKQAKPIKNASCGVGRRFDKKCL